MIGKGASEVRPVTLSEVERILEKRQGTIGEFGFEQQNALEYARRFARLKPADAIEMQHALEELGLKGDTAAKIADLLPSNKAQLLLVLSKDKEMGEKKLKEIEEMIAKCAKKARKIEAKVMKEEVEAPKEASDEKKEEPVKEMAPEEKKE